MRAAFALSALASAICDTNAQYFDGYLNVSSAVEPLQIRLAYAKDFDMMGEAIPSLSDGAYADIFHPKFHGTHSQSC